MSVMKYENITQCIYVETLKNKINLVCKRIGFDDSKVIWHIYEPKQNNTMGENSILERILIGQKDERYGYTDIEWKEIWIPTLSIKNEIGIDNEVNRAINGVVNFGKINRELLADVIIDEITHIQTGLNYGNKEYDALLIDYTNRYYLWKVNSFL